MPDSTHTRSLRRHLRMAFAMAVILPGLLGPAQPAAAGTACASGDCVLACDTRLRQCSMYSLQEITPRLTVVEFMPFGYKRVYSTSLCERRVCTRRNAACYPFS